MRIPPGHEARGTASACNIDGVVYFFYLNRLMTFGEYAVLETSAICALPPCNLQLLIYRVV